MAFLLAATVVVALVRVGLSDDGPAATKTKPKKTPIAQVRSGAPAAKRLYTVRAGDTLVTIAARTGVPVTRLRQLNPNAEPTSLFIGDQIRLR